MKRKNWKILLFIDNASSHEDLDLSHIKVKFFPPNTTSHTQRMDQGIIQAAKLKFRKKQLLHMIKMMDHHTTLSGPDLLKKTSVLDAIYWMNAAWNEVQTSTIQRCFARCGFEEQNKETEETDKDDDDDDDDDVPLAALQLTKDIFGCSFSELIDINSALHTCNTDTQDWNRPASEILNAMDGSPAVDSCDDDDDDDDDDDEGVCTISDANAMIENLLKFSKHHGSLTLFSAFMKADEEIAMMNVKKCKQSVISDFLHTADLKCTNQVFNCS